jgi:hypothetical protein
LASAGAFSYAGNNRQLAWFLRQGEVLMPETAPDSDNENSDKKYLQTTIGDLRKLYGADFAKGCADNEKIVDVRESSPHS